MKKLSLILFLLISLNSFSQANDSTVYKPSYIYLARAGEIGLNRSRVIVTGSLVTMFLFLNKDVSNNARVIVPSAFALTAFFMEIGVYSNLKKAGKALKKEQMAFYISPSSLRFTYKF
jgi:hypothetical protein